MKKMKVNKKGFTLIEMLVVVLIIGILAGIALPQYQMAVTKAKVASILPLMRRWKDALQEYKLQHGYYYDEDNDIGPDGSDLGVNWPSDWKLTSNGKACNDSLACGNDYWSECYANEDKTGAVYCYRIIDANNDFSIWIYQPNDEAYPEYAGMMTCQPGGTEGHKICKALGGKKLDEYVYKLN